MTYNAGQIVIVKFPFTNQQGAKQRPAVVVSSNAYNANRPDVVLMAVTSQIKQPLGFAEALVENWKDAGLLKQSVFKPVVFTAEKQIIRKPLGQPTKADFNAVQGVLDTVLHGK